MRIPAIAATVVLVVLSGAAIVGAFALLARRLLGLGFGLVRLLLAGLIGFAVAGPIAQSMAGSVSTRGSAIAPVWFLILAAAAALLVAMTFLVVAEALVPSGSLPNPLELRRQLRGRIARVRRYWQISRIAIHHGLLPMLRRLPRRIERIASAAEHGRLSVQVRLFADERDRRHVTGLLHQVLLTHPGGHRGHHGGAAARHRRRAAGDHRGEPVPAVRLQPPGDLLDPRAAGAGADLPAGPLSGRNGIVGGRRVCKSAPG